MRKDSGSYAVVVAASDGDKSVNRGAGGCSEVGEDSRGSKEDAQAVTNDSIVIDVMPKRCLDESFDREKLCRICHFSPERRSDANASKVVEKGSNADNHTTELILLGCGCKGELAMAHRCCAEAWFKLRHSRLCEICGETAKNVSGVGDNRFMEEWNDGRGHASRSTSSSDGDGGWSRRPFCNLLVACMVMAFILPWFFFRMNLF